MNINFLTNNAAFDDNRPGEIARILGLVAEQVEAGWSGGSICDSNGNTVGSWNDES
jgi:hypothetical protein